MKDMLMKLNIQMMHLLSEEDGQDLVEYALIFALIALGCCAGMKSLASVINDGFTSFGTTVSSNM